MILIVALFLGAVSAFSFQPFGLWPLMPLAFAGLCELITRSPTLRRSLLLGWLFAVGQFAVGLNWIATAFTFQAVMPAWLGWIAVVALSLYLAIYPMLAAGLAWRFGKDKPIALVLALAGSWAITEWLRATMLPVSRGTRSARRWSTRPCSARAAGSAPTVSARWWC